MNVKLSPLFSMNMPRIKAGHFDTQANSALRRKKLIQP